MALAQTDFKRMLCYVVVAEVGYIVGGVGLANGTAIKGAILHILNDAVMTEHPLLGIEILGHIKQLKTIIPGIKHHHEQYDGSGYPDGLKGEEIPLIARIIAVADTFDAMITDRPYQKGMSRDEAVAEITGNAGTQFDAQVLEAFTQALENDDI